MENTLANTLVGFGVLVFSAFGIMVLYWITIFFEHFIWQVTPISNKEVSWVLATICTAILMVVCYAIGQSILS